MIDWRFCGRFSKLSQNAFPKPYSWIDEEEAKRRYHDQSKELVIVAPIDPQLGITPYYITVTTKEHPSFHLTLQQPPGVPDMEFAWRNTDSKRIFCYRTTSYLWPPVEQIEGPGSIAWLSQATYWNEPDGTGRVTFYRREDDHTVEAQRSDIPVESLYLPFPAWGEWNTLLHGPKANTTPPTAHD